MGMFSTRQPRRFRGVHIYTSERKEKLDKIVEQAKREQQLERGEDVGYTPDIQSYRGKFTQNSSRLSRFTDPERRRLHPGVAIAIIVVLFIVWHWIMTGSWKFL